MDTAASNRTVPWSWYTDPEILRLEQDRIFGRFWQYAGHTGQVAEPGSFAATRAGHVPVVLVRDREGVLRAFVNVCRHRGSILCEGEGRRGHCSADTTRGPTSLDGSLRSAPGGPGSRASGATGSGSPLQVDTWGPFVFVNPDLDAPPLAEHLGELPG